MKNEDSPLCCCEYINENKDRSHLLFTCCDCEAIDSACDRLFKWQTMESNTLDKVVNTVSDRCRIPWYGGAKRVPLDVVLAVISLLFVVSLGAASYIFTFLSYLVVLPMLVFTIHRCIRSRNKQFANLPQHSKKNPSRSKFYFAWLVTSVSLLIVLYYTTIITTLKISALENFIFLFFTLSSTTSLFIAKTTSCQGFELQEEAEDLIESSAWKICNDCQHQVPRQASHCYKCGICYLLRDHHCLWLDTCISYVNDRWFVAGITSGLCALVYASYLIFTTVCHPRVLDLYIFTILYPSQCYDAYFDLQTSLATSSGCYCVILAFCTFFVFIQQIVCIVSGVKLREYMARRRVPGAISLSCTKLISNCIDFWIRR